MSSDLAILSMTEVKLSSTQLLKDYKKKNALNLQPRAAS